jgi:hypothetical protein
MPYGQGQMLGEGVDPRMFVQDYSGFTRAAEIQAQGMQNLGATIGQGIKDFGEARQERKKIDAEIKATSAGLESAIKMGKDLGIDIGGYLSPIQAKINDPNTSPAEALALGRTAAQGISNAFTLGIGAQERSIASQRARDENAFKLANLEVAQQRANIYGQKAQAEASELTRDTIKAFDPDTGQDKEWDVWKNKQGDLLTPDKKSRIVDPDKYIYGEPGGVQELPPTSQVGGISDSIAQTAKMNIGRLSTAKTPGTQGGGLGCADAVCKIYNQATGEELVKGGTLSTSKMIKSLSSDPRFQSVPVSQAQAGDIIVTPRGKRAGHTGIFVSDNEIASNSSKGFRGGQRGTLSQNYSKGSWMSSVDTRNPGSTQVFRRVGDDSSQQAMGTPEQQAEVGRMIEQGAGMRTAQAAPSGAMPTEPRINQQPQPAPRRMVGGRPVGGGAAQFRPSTPEEEQMYGSKGQVNISTGEFKPIRPPFGMVVRQTPEGGLEFVQGPGATDRFTKAAEEAQKQQVQSADINVQDLMEIKRMYADINQKEGVGPAVKRSAESFVIGTPMYALKAEMIEPFKKRLGLEQLTKMRQSSPTGGALGQVSNEEGTRLESIFGSLDPAASPRIFNRNIDRAIESYLDVIHGSIEERQKMVEEGKITAEQNAEIEAQYPSSTMDTMGIEQPRQTGGTGNPAIDEIIQRNNIQIK